jgi:hypothetical protein
MKKKTLKTIKIKDKVKFGIAIKYYILEHSNAPLISMEMHRLVQKFTKELEQVYLSEELQ